MINTGSAQISETEAQNNLKNFGYFANSKLGLYEKSNFDDSTVDTKEIVNKTYTKVMSDKVKLLALQSFIHSEDLGVSKLGKNFSLDNLKDKFSKLNFTESIKKISREIMKPVFQTSYGNICRSGMNSKLPGMGVAFDEAINNMISVFFMCFNTILDKTKEIRPNLSAPKEKWQEYSQSVLQILKNSFNTIANFATLHMDLGRIYQQMNGNRNPGAEDHLEGYKSNSEHFEIKEQSLSATPKLLLDLFSYIKENPFDISRPAYGCQAFNVEMPSKESGINKDASLKSDVFRECFDWMVAITESIFLPNLKNILSSDAQG